MWVVIQKSGTRQMLWQRFNVLKGTASENARELFVSSAHLQCHSSTGTQSRVFQFCRAQSNEPKEVGGTWTTVLLQTHAD